MKRHTFPLILFMLLAACKVQAHHSFSIYDIDNRIERTGVVTAYSFSNPHILLTVEAVNEDGSRETWEIETLNTGRWNRAGHPRDITRVGETVTILGWPARNGKDEMLLSTLVTERGRTVIIEEVKQRRAREGIPEVTIKRS